MTAPSNASVRDHVRLVLEKLKSHQKERTSTAAEDKKVNRIVPKITAGKRLLLSG